MQTRFEFILPLGYTDAEGNLHRRGEMRLATARDEIESLEDPRVQANEAWLPAVLLSRVVTRLGALSPLTPEIIAALFAADFSYLEDLYLQVNTAPAMSVPAVCPQCGHAFEAHLPPLEAA